MCGANILNKKESGREPMAVRPLSTLKNPNEDFSKNFLRGTNLPYKKRSKRSFGPFLLKKRTKKEN